MREEEIDSWIEGKGRGKEGEESLAAMVLSSKWIKREIWTAIGKEKKTDRAGVRERGGGLRWKGAIKGHGEGAGNAARSIEEWDLRDVATSQSVCFNAAVLISREFSCFSYKI